MSVPDAVKSDASPQNSRYAILADGVGLEALRLGGLDPERGVQNTSAAVAGHARRLRAAVVGSDGLAAQDEQVR